MTMLIFDDIFSWQGFGGVFQLAAGKCRLRIFDLMKNDHNNVMLLKPLVVVVSDLPDGGSKYKSISVRSCAGHIATSVIDRFDLDPHRMIYVEYYPASSYGDRNQHLMQAKYEMVDFVWHDRKALHPKWRPLPEAQAKSISELIAVTETISETDN